MPFVVETKSDPEANVAFIVLRGVHMLGEQLPAPEAFRVQPIVRSQTLFASEKSLRQYVSLA